jgi:hypothetical protein
MKSYLSGLIVPLTPSTRPTNVEHLARKEEQSVGYPFKILSLTPHLTPTNKEHEKAGQWVPGRFYFFKTESLTQSSFCPTSVEHLARKEEQADPTFHFNADPDPATHQSDANLRDCDHEYTDPLRLHFSRHAQF